MRKMKKVETLAKHLFPFPIFKLLWLIRPQLELLVPKRLVQLLLIVWLCLVVALLYSEASSWPNPVAMKFQFNCISVWLSTEEFNWLESSWRWKQKMFSCTQRQRVKCWLINYTVTLLDFARIFLRNSGILVHPTVFTGQGGLRCLDRYGVPITRFS